MKAQAVDKKFFKFVLPSMFTMFLSGLYTIVDGFFVGHAVGDVGLAGIGLVWPVTAVLIALGMGIGVGGSVLMSTARGAGCDENANAARANTLMLLVAASALLTLFLVFMNPVLVYALGARGEVYDAAMAYIRIISIGGSMQILASGLIPMIRNSHKTIQAMVIMSTGLVCNIILDACLTMVVPMGLAGAALATIIAQSLTVAGSLICLFRDREHPVRRRHFRLQKRMMAKMLRIGVSPFGLSLMPSVITVYNNLQCLAYGGDLAVSAYAVINYFIGSVLLLLEGVGEGMQPLISYASGAGDYAAMRRLKNRGLMTVLVFSALFLIAGSGPAARFFWHLGRDGGGHPVSAAHFGTGLSDDGAGQAVHLLFLCLRRDAVLHPAGLSGPGTVYAAVHFYPAQALWPQGGVDGAARRPGPDHGSARGSVGAAQKYTQKQGGRICRIVFRTRLEPTMISGSAATPCTKNGPSGRASRSIPCL